MHRLRVYVDTSVVGGCLDEEFKKESLALFNMARRDEVIILISDLLTEELARAPVEVQQVLLSLPPECVEEIRRSEESRRLRQAYVEENVVSPKSANDAHHVALATIAGADVVVSWNFKHIVHFDKIPKYNAVNVLNGYKHIGIYSPSEVIQYDDS